MQMMSWAISRLGSRFSLLFEPYRRRVLHSALGRLLDEPLDLMVGLVEPDGTWRVLPFSAEGELLGNPEQFERVNSITFRGYSEKYRLRFEFNVHSVFYPQDERLCSMPALYLEMRVNPVDRVRWTRPVGPTPDKVKLFIRLRRQETQITARGTEGEDAAAIDLSYSNPLTPGELSDPRGEEGPRVDVHERIVSLNPGCTCLDTGDGLMCELPITEAGSGIKWRMVWAAHVADPILTVRREGQERPARLRYTDHWADLDAVIEEAINTRDDRLAHSRRFEKVLDQAPLDGAERHLWHQSFQNWLASTFWCSIDGTDEGQSDQWFSFWDGAALHHSPLDVGYQSTLWELTLWPSLLELELAQWGERRYDHEASGGAFLARDLGRGTAATEQAFPYAMEVEENCDYLLLLQAYTHWTGHRGPAKARSELVVDLAKYLLWCDREGNGFPTEGVAYSLTGASSMPLGRKQTYLAIKRAAALRAAAGLLTLTDDEELALTCERTANEAIQQVDTHAWLGDHYAVCLEQTGPNVMDGFTGQSLSLESGPGCEAYTLHTGNGLVLPMIIGQPPLLPEDRVKRDLASSTRESRSRYGCGQTSLEPEDVVVSHNLWRDLLARYLRAPGSLPAQHYWDLQVMSNTLTQSLGYTDTYINSNFSFSPRGITSLGYLLAGPRLMIDRLAAGGVYITVDPDRHRPQRWPLLPLADWKAGKIPVCVVDDAGRVTIEGKTDPVIIHGSDPSSETTASGAGLIG